MHHPRGFQVFVRCALYHQLFSTLFILIAITMGLTACGGSSDAADQASRKSNNDPVVRSVSVTVLALPAFVQNAALPGQISAVLIVDPASIKVEHPIGWDQSQQLYSSQVDIISGAHNLVVEFHYREAPNYTNIVLATASQSVTIAANSNDNQVNFPATKFSAIDSDADGADNITEIIDGSVVDDPYSRKFSVSGTITGLAKEPVSGLLVYLRGKHLIANKTEAVSGSTTTDVYGRYRFSHLDKGTYRISPDHTSYSMKPYTAYANIDRADVDKSFIAGNSGYSLSGDIAGPDGAIVSLAGDNIGDEQVSNGRIQFSNLSNGSYVLYGSGSGFMINLNAVISDLDNDVGAVPVLASFGLAPSTISGNVRYGGLQSGRIFLQVVKVLGSGQEEETDIGTVLDGPGSYSISGVPISDYFIRAFRDHRGTSIRHAGNAFGQSANSSVLGSTTDFAIQLSDPIDPGYGSMQAPKDLTAYAMDGFNMLHWGEVSLNGYEWADYYTVYWSKNSDLDPTPSVNDGSRILKASSNTSFIHGGLNNGDRYRYAVSATDENGFTSAAKPLGNPIVVGVTTTDTATLSGKVAFTPANVGSLVIGVHNNETDIYRGTYISNPVSPQAYTISAIPAGGYKIFAFLDANGDGEFDAGDIKESERANVDISDGQTKPNFNLVLNNDTVYASLISKGTVTGASGYRYQLQLIANKNIPVAATINGVNVVKKTDQDRLEFDYQDFRTNFGTYSNVSLTLDDGSIQTLQLPVTGMLDNRPTALTPVGNITGFNPSFTWQPPSYMTPSYSYQFWSSILQNNPVNMSSQTLSMKHSDLPVGTQAIQVGTSYDWWVRVVDEFGNSVESPTATFTLVP